MRLQNIKIDQCPICGCMTVVCEKQKDRHCNGKFSETREWSCHYTLEFSPNYTKTRVVRLCKKDPKYTKMEKEKKQVADTITKALKKIGYKGSKVKTREYYRTLHTWHFDVTIYTDKE